MLTHMQLLTRENARHNVDALKPVLVELGDTESLSDLERIRELLRVCQHAHQLDSAIERLIRLRGFIEALHEIKLTEWFAHIRNVPSDDLEWAEQPYGYE